MAGKGHRPQAGKGGISAHFFDCETNGGGLIKTQREGGRAGQVRLKIFVAGGRPLPTFLGGLVWEKKLRDTIGGVTGSPNDTFSRAKEKRKETCILWMN